MQDWDLIVAGIFIGFALLFLLGYATKILKTLSEEAREA
jgi:hypothetical protein